MDAFYASVELLRYPQLKGLPVVIGGGRRHQPVAQPDGSLRFAKLAGYKGRGVITTATYAARDLGVHSGMGLMKAALRAPDAVLLPTDFEQYRAYSRRFKAAVAEVAPQIEDRGIDEIYIDLTDVPGAQDAVGHDPFGGVRAVAQDIRNNVRRATGLTCSIGITPNKLLSKLASEFDKPDGLTLFTEAEVPRLVWPLPARKLNGIGPKAAAKLTSLGLHSLGDVAAAQPSFLVEHFGKSYGRWLHQASHGVDDRPVSTGGDPVSMSHETTFDRDLSATADRIELGRILDELVARLARDLQRKGYVGRNVAVKLRFDDFKIITRAQTLDAFTAEAADIRHSAGLCLKRVVFDRKLRLLGVRMGVLRNASALQHDSASFEEPSASKLHPTP
jgi:DNA polymerase IV